MYNKTKRINNKGFTLIEIIASIAILGMVIVVFLPMFPQMMNWTKHTDDELIASNLLGQYSYNVEENFKEIQDNGTCSDKIAVVIDGDYSDPDEDYFPKIERSKSIDEKDLGLYGIHINIYSIKKPDKPLSDTYMYLVCNGENDG